MQVDHADVLGTPWWRGEDAEPPQPTPEDALPVDGEEAGAGVDGDESEGQLIEVDIDDLDDIEYVDESSNSRTSLDHGMEVDTDWEDSVPKRDERIDEYDGDAGHEGVREFLREQGIAKQMQEAFDDLGTAERDSTSTRGDVLDMRNVIRRLSGDTTIDDYYRRREQTPADEIAVGVSLDMSGSMAEDEKQAKAAVGAFLDAVQANGGDVVANAWKAVGSTAECHLVTNPYEPFRWAHLDAITPGGSTPTGAGVWDAGMLLDATRLRDKLLLVVTDGSPTTMARGIDTSSSTDEAETTVQQLRDLGMTVVGFGFGPVNEETLGEIFGEDGYRAVDLPDLPDALVEVYEEQYDDHLQRLSAV